MSLKEDFKACLLLGGVWSVAGLIVAAVLTLLNVSLPLLLGLPIYSFAVGFLGFALFSLVEYMVWRSQGYRGWKKVGEK